MLGILCVWRFENLHTLTIVATTCPMRCVFPVCCTPALLGTPAVKNKGRGYSYDDRSRTLIQPSPNE